VRGTQAGQRAPAGLGIVRQRLQCLKPKAKVFQADPRALEREARQPTGGAPRVALVVLGGHEQADVKRIHEIDARQLGGGIANLIEPAHAQGALKTRIG
jgi:hypothetical protein